MQVKNKYSLLAVTIAVVISVGLVAVFVYATTTVGNNVSIGGTLDVTATSTLATTTVSELTVTGNTTTTGTLGIGGGTAIVRHLSASTTITAAYAASIAATSCAVYATTSVSGAAIGDIVVATPAPASTGIEDVSLIWNAYVSESNLVTIRACNPTPSAIDIAVDQSWRIDIWKH